MFWIVVFFPCFFSQGHSRAGAVPHHHHLLLQRCHGNYASVWHHKCQKLWEHQQMAQKHRWGKPCKAFWGLYSCQEENSICVPWKGSSAKDVIVGLDNNWTETFLLWILRTSVSKLYIWLLLVQPPQRRYFHNCFRQSVAVLICSSWIPEKLFICNFHLIASYAALSKKISSEAFQTLFKIALPAPNYLLAWQWFVILDILSMSYWLDGLYWTWQSTIWFQMTWPVVWGKMNFSSSGSWRI